MEVICTVISGLQDVLELIYCILLFKIFFDKIDSKNSNVSSSKIRMYIVLAIILFEGLCLIMHTGSWISFILWVLIAIWNARELKRLK